jgi:5-(carboxyamino)imidazole ribonucleotide synthase
MIAPGATLGLLQTIAPGATLGLLGGGQLGRMFAQAALRMGYRVVMLDPDAEAPAAQLTRHLLAAYDDEAALAELARSCAAVTTEFENPPAQALSWLAQRLPVRPSASAVAIAQDRSKEKTFLRDSGFPVAPFVVVRSAADLDTLSAAFKFPALLKTSRFGYDGKGQARIEDRAQARAVFERWNAVECVLEELVPLQREISVVLARGADGATACFPVSENAHRNGILDVTIAPARVSTQLVQSAQNLALGIAQKLDYVGVLAVEMFVLPGEVLLINELAPRPHNSGHYTIDACVTDQFEQQVRALCALPLGSTDLLRPAVMVNLLGDVWQNGAPDWSCVLRHPQAKLHLYGKREARAGRKMGHVTVTGADVQSALATAFEIKRQLGMPN